MKNALKKCNKYISRLANLYNVTHHIEGKFKILFSPAHQIPDSDGNSIIDTYMVPIDETAEKEVDNNTLSGNEKFLHLQVLEGTIPIDYLGYEYCIHVDPVTENDSSPQVKAFVYDINWRDPEESKELFKKLNTLT